MFVVRVTIPYETSTSRQQTKLFITAITKFKHVLRRNVRYERNFFLLVKLKQL